MTDDVWEDMRDEGMDIGTGRWDDTAPPPPAPDDAVRESPLAARERDVHRDLRAENERLWAVVSDYEHRISWDTTCRSCAALLDAAYADTARAERAEADLAAALAGERAAVGALAEVENALGSDRKTRRTHPTTDDIAALMERQMEVLAARDAALAGERAARAETERLRAALVQIAEHEPPSHELDADQMAERAACSACAHAKERHWPPSGLCDKHYSAMVKVHDRNDRERATQHYAMREIARAALSPTGQDRSVPPLAPPEARTISRDAPHPTTDDIAALMERQMEVLAERDAALAGERAARDLLGTVLATFQERACIGGDVVRSGWVSASTVARWRAALSPTPPDTAEQEPQR